LLLDPTSPARVPEQVTIAMERLVADSSLDGVVSVSEPTFNPVWVGVAEERDTGRLRRFSDAGTGVTRRQDLDRYLRVNGNFYLWRSAFVRRLDSSWLDEGAHAGLEIPEAQAFSIDDDYEFRLIEALVAAGLIDLPWMETS
jgi:CMP-N,N'-diacetyllegionaminic acid synthase